MNRRLYRCQHDRRLAGVASGVAEYFDLDPTLVRILWFLSIFLGGLGILVYIGLAIIVPAEPLTSEELAAATTDAPTGHRHAPRGNGPWTTIVGVALILFGGLALADRVLPGLDGELIVPAIVIVVGALLVASSIKREPMET